MRYPISVEKVIDELLGQRRLILIEEAEKAVAKEQAEENNRVSSDVDARLKNYKVWAQEQLVNFLNNLIEYSRKPNANPSGTTYTEEEFLSTFSNKSSYKYLHEIYSAMQQTVLSIENVDCISEKLRQLNSHKLHAGFKHMDLLEQTGELLQNQLEHEFVARKFDTYARTYRVMQNILKFRPALTNFIDDLLIAAYKKAKPYAKEQAINPQLSLAERLALILPAEQYSHLIEDICHQLKEKFNPHLGWDIVDEDKRATRIAVSVLTSGLTSNPVIHIPPTKKPSRELNVRYSEALIHTHKLL